MITAKKRLWFLKTSTESQSRILLKRARLLYTWALFQGTKPILDSFWRAITRGCSVFARSDEHSGVYSTANTAEMAFKKTRNIRNSIDFAKDYV